MFEQKQDSGKSASLAEKYANAVAQLSDSNDRAARAEHDLQVERKTSYACLKKAMTMQPCKVTALFEIMQYDVHRIFTL